MISHMGLSLSIAQTSELMWQIFATEGVTLKEKGC